MPYTIKSANMKYKNNNGEYVSINAISDNTTNDQIAAIESAGASSAATQEAAIEAKGEEVLESIPQDYTTLSAEVTNLNNAFNFNIYDGTMQYSTFVQGSRGAAGTIVANNARCTTAKVFALRVNDVISISNIDTGFKVAIAGVKNNAVVYDSGWLTAEKSVTCAAAGDYFVNVSKVSGANFTPSEISTLTVGFIDGASRITNISKNLDNLQDEIDANTSYNYDDVAVTLSNNKVINASRAVVSGAGNVYNVSDIITVSPGEVYTLDAYMNWNNYFYVFYDSANTAFGGVKSNNSGTYVHLENETITIPDNAVGMRIGVVIDSLGKNYSFKKRETILIAGALTDSLSDELDNKYIKKWTNKTWVVVGDSLTENNATASEKYHYLIAQQTGINVLNYGKSGTGYGKTYDTSENFCNRVLTLANVDCDIITIFGSFNDLSLDLGTADDTGTNTIGGWMNTTFDNLYSTKPFVSVGVILPTPWWGKTPDGSTADRQKAVQYCEMLKTIAERRSIPVLDLFHRSNLHPNESNFRDEYYSNADGVHPNNAGHAKFAPMILQFLKEIVEM